MRLWSLHPRYLDTKGLLALWREGLLAQAVLQGKTTGYRNHPQLDRFRAQPDPRRAIGRYLWAVHAEAASRHYRFDSSKLPPEHSCPEIPVSRGQLLFEWKHLLSKLAIRAPERIRKLGATRVPECHPLFEPRPGPVEPWERIPEGAKDQA